MAWLSVAVAWLFETICFPLLVDDNDLAEVETICFPLLAAHGQWRHGDRRCELHCGHMSNDDDVTLQSATKICGQQRIGQTWWIQSTTTTTTTTTTTIAERGSVPSPFQYRVFLHSNTLNETRQSLKEFPAIHHQTREHTHFVSSYLLPLM